MKIESQSEELNARKFLRAHGWVPDGFGGWYKSGRTVSIEEALDIELKEAWSGSR